MLDERLIMLDAAEIGAPYATRSFSDLELLPPNRVRFRFIGDTDWTVTLLPEPEFRLPLLSEPKAVSRKLGFKRHFVVDGDPKPQSG